MQVHVPTEGNLIVPTHNEEMAIEVNNDPVMPELVDNDGLVDDDNESGSIVEEEQDLQDLDKLLNFDSTDSDKVTKQQQVPLRRSSCTTKGVKCYDNYSWNLMNLSITSVIKNFREVAKDACRAELEQLFREK